MKKLISVMLAVVMAMCVCLIPASAADGTASTGKIESIIEEYFATVTGVDEDADIQISKDLVNEIKSTSIETVAENLGSMVFLKADDIDSTTLDKLLADTNATVLVKDNGEAELYIGINLADHPELFEVDVFRAYVKNVVDNSDEYFADHGYDPETTEAKLVYDEYLRFAGELALHMLVYNVLSPFAKITSGSIINDLVNKAVYAEINHSEDRAPIWFCVIIGFYFMNIATFIKIF